MHATQWRYIVLIVSKWAKGGGVFHANPCECAPAWNGRGANWLRARCGKLGGECFASGAGSLRAGEIADQHGAKARVRGALARTCGRAAP
jgi:hypothetical protein